MTWKVREEGSPRVREGLSLEQVVEGLEEGEWGPTDEVRGPNDRDWTRFENHPEFSDAVALEPLPSHEDEETHIDMTPIIDVAMVLLVFFILIFTVFGAGEAAGGGRGGRGRAGRHHARAGEEPDDQGDGHAQERPDGLPRGGRPKPTPADQLGAVLGRFVRSTSHTTLLLAAADDVPHGDTVFVEDQAKGAGMDKVMLAAGGQAVTASGRREPADCRWHRPAHAGPLAPAPSSPP